MEKKTSDDDGTGRPPQYQPGMFMRMMADASSDVKRETKPIVTKSNLTLDKVLNFLEELDLTGFEEMFEFEEKHWRVFDSDGKSEVGEHKLEHTSVHSKFCVMFERKLEQYVTGSCGISIEEFSGLVQDDASRNGKDGLGGRILDFVSSGSDFESWANYMKTVVYARKKAVNM